MINWNNRWTKRRITFSSLYTSNYRIYKARCCSHFRSYNFTIWHRIESKLSSYISISIWSIGSSPTSSYIKSQFIFIVWSIINKRNTETKIRVLRLSIIYIPNYLIYSVIRWIYSSIETYSWKYWLNLCCEWISFWCDRNNFTWTISK